MENKKNELTSAAENINEVSEPIAEELEFIQAEETETAEEKESAHEQKKEEEQKTEEAVEAEISEPAESEDETEATESEEAEEKEENNSPAYLLKLVGVLTLICTCIALLLAVVNSITADRIAENTAKQKREAILAIFPDGTDTAEFICDDGTTAYFVYRDGEPIGYCINSSGSGFGGNVEVMVGLELTGEVHGIKIVSMSETPGIGTKVQSDSFLGQFVGQKGSAEADIISGATFSSNAVKDAVAHALSVEVDVYGITENTEKQ